MVNIRDVLKRASETQGVVDVDAAPSKVNTTMIPYPRIEEFIDEVNEELGLLNAARQKADVMEQKIPVEEDGDGEKKGTETKGQEARC